jgi:hypothetical protein
MNEVIQKKPHEENASNAQDQLAISCSSCSYPIDINTSSYISSFKFVLAAWKQFGARNKGTNLKTTILEEHLH